MWSRSRPVVADVNLWLWEILYKYTQLIAPIFHDLRWTYVGISSNFDSIFVTGLCTLWFLRENFRRNH